MVNDNGGTKIISDFPLFVDSTSVTSGVQNNFNVGTYTVSETEQAGYTSTITGDCASDGTINLVAGDVKTCTITNDDFIPNVSGGGGGGGGSIILPVEPILKIEPVLTISEESIRVSFLNENGAIITWTTNYPGSSYIIYSSEDESRILDYSDNSGNPPKYGYANASDEKDFNQKVLFHSVVIFGLNPNTNYYFRTVSRGSLSISEEYKITISQILITDPLTEKKITSTKELASISVLEKDKEILNLENIPLENGKANQKEEIPIALFDVSSSFDINSKKLDNVFIFIFVIIFFILIIHIIYKIYKKI